MRSLFAFAFSLLTVATLQAAYIPERVFHTDDREFTDFEAMLADSARSDVLMVGEQHDDPNTHSLELAVLEGLARRRRDIVVGLEMFDRDVQEPLDHFQAGRMNEQDFLKSARPWPNYQNDYRPLVEFAIKQQWPVFGSNVPRTFASEVSRAGFDALKGKSDDELRWFARDLDCPVDDDYFDRFAEAMGEHPARGRSSPERNSAQRQSLERYYQAQCLRDETMAESIALAYEMAAAGGKRPLVVHFNGAFHSDFTLGTAQRAKRRLPGKRVVVLSMLPVESLDGLSPNKSERKRADYLVYTIRSKS